MTVCNPKIQLSYSDDGGFTWSQPRNLQVGKIGAYPQLVRAWRLGQSRNRVYKVVYTDNTPFAIFGAQLDTASTPSGTN